MTATKRPLLVGTLVSAVIALVTSAALAGGNHSNELPWRESVAGVVVIPQDADGHLLMIYPLG